jgi:hypothetical protein
MTAHLQVAGVSYALDEAKCAIAGYAFAQQADTAWTAPQGMRYGEAPNVDRPYRWAYRSYDCAARHDGSLDTRDLWGPAGLDGRLTANRVLRMQSTLDAVNDALGHLEPRMTFWDLPLGQIERPAEGERGWWLTRAWWLLRGAAGPKAWVTPYKVLHLKRPALFPLIDNRTWPLLQDCGGPAWTTIHQDLKNQVERFRELEEWFAEFTARQNPSGVPLTRLRLHDILLWCHAVGQRELAAEAGQALLEPT